MDNGDSGGLAGFRDKPCQNLSRAYYCFGYPRHAFRSLNYYIGSRLKTHLNRRSQRKYHKPKDVTHYRYLQELGLYRL